MLLLRNIVMDIYLYDDRHWWMADNEGWETMGNDRQSWGMANEGWETMGNDTVMGNGRQWGMRDHGEW